MLFQFQEIHCILVDTYTYKQKKSKLGARMGQPQIREENPNNPGHTT